MKCVVIYFSQTGNTEKIAKAIQIGVKQVTDHCNVIALKEANPRRLYEYDLIGLGCPVYHGVEPGNVAAFINDMRFVGGKHVFVFSTHCTLPYWFLPSIVTKLQRKGLIVIGTGDWYGASYHPQNQPEPYPTDGHPDEIDLKEAEDFGREMVERSHKISDGETALIPPAPEKLPSPEWRRGAARLIGQWRDNVRLNVEKCLYPECRLCMDNCPMYGIDLSVKPPVYAKPCIGCTFCEMICPTGAVEADDWFEASTAEEHKLIKGRFLQRLAEAEAQGRFRRLVPVEKIGWDTPHYKAHNTHPRWIIGKGYQ